MYSANYGFIFRTVQYQHKFLGHGKPGPIPVSPTNDSCQKLDELLKTTQKLRLTDNFKPYKKQHLQQKENPKALRKQTQLHLVWQT